MCVSWIIFQQVRQSFFSLVRIRKKKLVIMTHLPSQVHKTIVEHFTDAVNQGHIHRLDEFLDENIEKILNSKAVYKGRNGAREYYSMEHEAYPKARWTILSYLDSQHKNTIFARTLFDNKVYHTLYTFGPSGKIQEIEATYVSENNIDE